MAVALNLYVVSPKWGKSAKLMTSGVFDIQVSTLANLDLAYYAAGDFRQGLDVARQVIALIPGELYSARFGLPILPAAVFRGWVACGLAELGDFAAGASM